MEAAKACHPMNTLFSLGYWAFVAVMAILLFPGAVLIWLLTPFDPARSLLHRYTCWWAQLYLCCLPRCRIQVEGREKIVPHTPYVLVANHQSAADIMALSALAVPFKWISKKQNFRIPIIGWNMYLNGYIRVEPGNPRSIRTTMERCKSWLQRGVPSLWFPEGHRSATGEMQRFHGGAFRLAAECGCAVVPIVVDGTGAVYGDWRLAARPGIIRIQVLDPISLAEVGGTADGLREHSWKRMEQMLMTIRRQHVKENST
jgi:1-acyl-sn-glycerol-3-phosphate acyltransferase